MIPLWYLQLTTPGHSLTKKQSSDERSLLFLLIALGEGNVPLRGVFQRTVFLFHAIIAKRSNAGNTVAPVLLLTAILGGCAITESTVVDRNGPPQPGTVACSSNLGSYSLPKSFVRVVIGRKNEAGARPDFVAFGNPPADGKFRFEIVRRADPALTLCLDYLASAFAHDEIAVTKQDTDATKDNGISPTTSRQFLRSVIVNATDRSVQIAQNLIRAAFVGLSGNENFGVNRDIPIDQKPIILADLEFDPFDARASAEANSRLSPLGFCLVLEDFTFDRGSLSIDQYCNSPFRARTHLSQVAELYAAKSREPIPPNSPGVLYRPRQTFMISAYRKDGRGRWHLSRRVEAEFENLSPVISVGVSRAAFARRNAALIFEEGTLQTVCTAKSSEIENFVAIPFEISRALVALPSQIVKVRINRIAQREELARVEELFIRTQAALLKTQMEQKAQQKETGNTAKAEQVSLNDPLFDSSIKALAADANTFTINNEALAAWITQHCGPQLTIAPPQK